MIWQDRNSNGRTDQGELTPLSATGIKSINLNYRLSSWRDGAGNSHRQRSEVIWQDGHQSAIDDVWLKTDPWQVKARAQEAFAPLSAQLKQQIKALPSVHGMGDLAPLSVAMANDAQLIAKVNAYLRAKDSNKDQALDELLYHWAKLGDQPIHRRGEMTDGRELAVLEKLVGHPFYQQGFGNAPGPNAAPTSSISYLSAIRPLWVLS